MANDEHLAILKQGVEAWNEWWRDPSIMPDLRGADLTGAALSDVRLSGADLREADLRGAELAWAALSFVKLGGADLREATLSNAYLRQSDLRGADLRGALLADADLSLADLGGTDLRGADLGGAFLRDADLTRADLSGADLSEATLVRTDLRHAVLTGCCVYGISAWDLQLQNVKDQSGLVITPWDQPAITVDNLEVAQFVYLLLNNQKIRDVIDTIGKKGVLILGRFTPERKAVLDGIRKRLRDLGFVPMMFDFEKPTEADFTGTIRILAGMSRFIIADITNPRSSPLELREILPNYAIPFVPIIDENEKPFAMFADLRKYPWLLPLRKYDSADGLVRALKNAVVVPALEEYERLKAFRTQEPPAIHVKDFL